MFLYDGKTGDKISELTADGQHKGTVFSLSWSPDSKQILSASADMTAKIWDANTKQVVQYLA
jgi:WD40 repeat protein